jgi:hypothetical protein
VVPHQRNQAEQFEHIRLAAAFSQHRENFGELFGIFEENCGATPREVLKIYQRLQLCFSWESDFRTVSIMTYISSQENINTQDMIIRLSFREQYVF